MATAAERWRSRQTRRLARDAASLEHRARSFGRMLERDDGPYADDARDLVSTALLLLLSLAGRLDGMREVTDLMTEESQ